MGDEEVGLGDGEDEGYDEEDECDGGEEGLEECTVGDDESP